MKLGRGIARSPLHNQQTPTIGRDGVRPARRIDKVGFERESRRFPREVRLEGDPTRHPTIARSVEELTASAPHGFDTAVDADLPDGSAIRM
jgi:hypothetical protein